MTLLLHWSQLPCLRERKHYVPRVCNKEKSLHRPLFLTVCPGELVKMEVGCSLLPQPPRCWCCCSPPSPPAPGRLLLQPVLKRSSGCHTCSFWCQVCAISPPWRQVDVNESCDVGTADLRESSRSLDSAGSPLHRSQPVRGSCGHHICPSSVAQITPTRKEMLGDTDT